MRVIKELRRVNNELVEKHKEEIKAINRGHVIAISRKNSTISSISTDKEIVRDNYFSVKGELDFLKESINSENQQLNEEIEELREYKDKYINLLAAYKTLDLKKKTE